MISLSVGGLLLCINYSLIQEPQFFSNPTQDILKHDWSPYADNGGSTLGIAGKDFCVIAADTRLSEGYSIATRNGSKIIKLTEKTVLASAGMQADILTLHKTIVARLEQYKHQMGKEMSTTAIAQMLSIMLYHKRFFPYYTFNVLGGVDDDGIGCAFSYDAVGSYQRVKYSSSGSGQKLLQPILDNQVGFTNRVESASRPENIPVHEIEDLVRDCFISAGERDIYTGDYVDMYSVTKDGVKYQQFNLKFD